MRPRPIIRSECVRAPWPCAPPLPCVPSFAVHTSRCRAHPRYAPPCSRARPPLSFAPPAAVHASFAVRASLAVRVLLCCAPRARLLCRARLSHPCVPLPYAPPEYKFHKVVVHSTTWASGPLTTEKWLTAGCLGGDHSF
jgi:hypothetical protein